MGQYIHYTQEEKEAFAEEKNNREQIEMCFRAMRAEAWEALFD